MTKKNMSLFRTLLALTTNQSGHIGFGPRYRLMAPDDGGEGGGGADDGKEKPYSKEFVEKLLREKNNFKTAKEKAEADLAEALKAKPAPKKDDEGGENNKYKELLAAKDEENKKTADRLAKLEKEKEDGMKLGALREEFEKNGGDPKKFPLIQRLAETSKIIIDEDSGVVYGGEGEIKRIKELAPELFGKARKGVEDGDGDSNNQHDKDETGDDAFKKALETKRLKKSKEGKNPFAELYAAKGIKVVDKR